LGFHAFEPVNLSHSGRSASKQWQPHGSRSLYEPAGNRSSVPVLFTGPAAVLKTPLPDRESKHFPESHRLDIGRTPERNFLGTICPSRAFDSRQKHQPMLDPPSIPPHCNLPHPTHRTTGAGSDIADELARPEKAPHQPGPPPCFQRGRRLPTEATAFERHHVICEASPDQTSVLATVATPHAVSQGVLSRVDHRSSILEHLVAAFLAKRPM